MKPPLGHSQSALGTEQCSRLMIAAALAATAAQIIAADVWKIADRMLWK